ncbi:MAG: hypothetical protein DDG60_01660 [Anaerolineae bacterium]|nr:MAG: hypothetical protein DDG60_01660 [Anaerolineae bacterium]
MTPDEKRLPFLGTYFDCDSVLRLERRMRWLGWAIFAIYLLQYVYDMGMFLYNNLVNQFAIDWMYLLFNLGRPFQGLMILAVLHGLAAALLILLDIEQNTRRAGRFINIK